MKVGEISYTEYEFGVEKGFKHNENGVIPITALFS